MYQVLIFAGIAFLAQALLSFRQMKHFTDEFVAMRKRGKVATGRKSGGFNAGAIVFFLLDDDGIIREGKKLEGVTSFAKIKPLEGFEGRYVGDLTEEDGPKGHRNLRKAIADAAMNYRRFEAGEAIPEPPAPFERVGAAFGMLRKRVSL